MALDNQSYNIKPIDVSVNGSSDPTKYFNNYFGPTFQVSQNVDDAILSYFEEVCDNKAAAKIMASAVIYTSYTQKIDPMETLKEFIRVPKGQLNEYLTMFLNLQRVGTSYLGVTNSPVLNKYVERTILP
jgi:hypothetical protein